MKLLSVIFANGLSTRFCNPLLPWNKVLLPVQGESILARLARQCATVSNTVVIVTNPDDWHSLWSKPPLYQPVPGNIRPLFPVNRHQSKTRSLFDVMNRFPSFDSILLCQGDCVYREGTLPSLVEVYRNDYSGIGAIVGVAGSGSTCSGVYLKQNPLSLLRGEETSSNTLSGSVAIYSAVSIRGALNMLSGEMTLSLSALQTHAIAHDTNATPLLFNVGQMFDVNDPNAYRACLHYYEVPREPNTNGIAQPNWPNPSMQRTCAKSRAGR